MHQVYEHDFTVQSDAMDLSAGQGLDGFYKQLLLHWFANGETGTRGR